MKNDAQIRDRKEAADTRQAYIIESVDILVDEHDIFEVIGSLRRLKHEWQNPETIDSQNKTKKMLADIHGIETLLIEIAEASAKYNQLLLNTYEQVPE